MQLPQAFYLTNAERYTKNVYKIILICDSLPIWANCELAYLNSPAPSFHKGNKSFFLKCYRTNLVSMFARNLSTLVSLFVGIYYFYLFLSVHRHYCFRIARNTLKQSHLSHEETMIDEIHTLKRLTGKKQHKIIEYLQLNLIILFIKYTEI